MTKYNNTDKIIREKFESMDPAFDAESMWGELAPVVEKKRRRGFLFWVMSGVIFVSLIMMNFDFFNSHKANALANNITVEEQDKETDISPDDNNKYSLMIEENTLSEIQKQKQNKIQNNPNEMASDVILDSNNEASQVVHADVKALNKTTDFVATNFVSLDAFDGNASESQLDTEKTPKIEFGTIEKDRDELNLLIDIPVISSTIQYTRAIEIIEEDEFGDIAYTQPLNANEWRIALNAGYYIHSRSFKNNGMDESDNFSSRSKEEKAKDGYDLGIKLEYFLSDHFVLLGGLRFSQSFVKRSAEYSYTETITLEDHVVAIINTEQGPIEVKENITYDGIFTHDADNYITATRLGLITGLQYRLRSARWISHFDLGLEIPFWNSHSGVITNNRRPYNLSDETELINTSSIQIFGGIGMEYTLSPSIALQATIGGYMPINNEHVESYIIEKKSSLLGLNLGVHFRL